MKKSNQSIQLGVYQLCMVSIPLFLGGARRRGEQVRLRKVGVFVCFHCVFVHTADR